MNLKKYSSVNILVYLILFITLIVVSRLSLFIAFSIYNGKNGYPISLYTFLLQTNITDSSRYAQIAIEGYVPTETGSIYLCNFFPLYPLLLRLFHFIIPINIFAKYPLNNIYLLSFIINPFLLIITCLFSYKYLLLTRNNKEEAILSIILLIIGPFAFISAETSSETLFMPLLIMAMYCLKKKYYIRMGICGALLTATRFIGVFFVIFVLIDIIKQYIKDKKTKRSFIGFIKYCLNQPTLLLGVSLIPIGLIAYMIFLQIKFNDGLAFLHTQIYEYEHFYIGYFRILFKAEPPQLIMLLLSFIILIYLIYKKRYEEVTLPVITYLIVGPSTLLSFNRYFFSYFVLMFGFLDMLYSINLKSIKVNKIARYSLIAAVCFYELVLDYYVYTYYFPLVV